MKTVAIITLVVALGALPVPTAAEDSDVPFVPTPEGGIGQGVDLLSQGARLLLRGLLEEVEPTMREFDRALSDLNWQGLGVEDLGEYRAPEVLPNGDIILRRKTPLKPAPPPAKEIDL